MIKVFTAHQSSQYFIRCHFGHLKSAALILGNAILGQSFIHANFQAMRLLTQAHGIDSFQFYERHQEDSKLATFLLWSPSSSSDCRRRFIVKYRSTLEPQFIKLSINIWIIFFTRTLTWRCKSWISVAKCIYKGVFLCCWVKLMQALGKKRNKCQIFQGYDAYSVEDFMQSS